MRKVIQLMRAIREWSHLQQRTKATTLGLSISRTELLCTHRVETGVAEHLTLEQFSPVIEE